MNRKGETVSVFKVCGFLRTCDCLSDRKEWWVGMGAWWGAIVFFAFFTLGCIRAWSWHTRSSVFVVACEIFTCITRTLGCGMGDLVPWPGIELRPPVLEVWSFSHWTIREAPCVLSLRVSYLACCCSITKSRLTLCNPMDCSPPGSSVCGISQARILDGVGCCFLLQGILLTQGLNLCLLHWQVGSLPLSLQESPGFYLGGVNKIISST